jgi:hypothetical protein
MRGGRPSVAGATDEPAAAPVVARSGQTRFPGALRRERSGWRLLSDQGCRPRAELAMDCTHRHSVRVSGEFSVGAQSVEKFSRDSAGFGPPPGAGGPGDAGQGESDCPTRPNISTADSNGSGENAGHEALERCGRPGLLRLAPHSAA